MKAIIVAGGRGERLRPITNNVPKPMIKVKGKPVLLHVIELLKKYGIKEIILALCYLPDVITTYFGNGEKFGVNIKYIFEDPNSPKGTAGAILPARDLINDTFIVTYADILRDLDVSEMMTFHESVNSIATVNIYKRIGKNAKSMVKIDDNKKIVEFIERPTPNQLSNEFIWVNGSFYIFEPEIFEFIPEGEKNDFGSEIFPRVLKSKKNIYAFPTEEYFLDIGDMEKLNLAINTFKNK